MNENQAIAPPAPNAEEEAKAYLKRQRELETKRRCNQRARERYKAQGLTTSGKPFKRKPKGWVPRYRTAEYKRQAYLRQKERNAARGLTSAGTPWKQKPHRKRETLLNGTSSPLEQSQPQPEDNMGEAARAIIVAAQVLRSVGIGLKL